MVLRRSPPARKSPLPSAIVTAGPPFRHEGLPVEVGLLLPNTRGASALIANAVEWPACCAGRALGLFLADPFLNLSAEMAALKQAKIGCIANLPSVAQQDAEFVQQLEDVGLDFAREVDRLGQLRQGRFRVVGVVSDASAAARLAAVDPTAVVVLPRVADFAAGFPSFRQRGAIAQQVAGALAEAGWRGPLLGLATADEAAHETLWPEALDGVLCRPETLSEKAAPSVSP